MNDHQPELKPEVMGFPELTENKPEPLTLLGRHLGTFTGWDACGPDALQFYDFVPAEGTTIPECWCLYCDFTLGHYQCSLDDPDATVFETGDLISALRDLPQVV